MGQKLLEIKNFLDVYRTFFLNIIREIQFNESEKELNLTSTRYLEKKKIILNHCHLIILLFSQLKDLRHVISLQIYLMMVAKIFFIRNRDNFFDLKIKQSSTKIYFLIYLKGQVRIFWSDLMILIRKMVLYENFSLHLAAETIKQNIFDLMDISILLHHSSIELKLIESKFMNQNEHFGQNKTKIFNYYLQLIIIIESGLMILLQHITKQINCNLILGNDNIESNKIKKNEISKTNKVNIFFEKICDIIKILDNIECSLKKETFLDRLNIIKIICQRLKSHCENRRF